MNNAKRTSGVTRVVFIVLCSLLVIYTAIMALMLLWGLMTSLKSRIDFTENYIGFPILDKNNEINSYAEFFQLSNYKKVLEHLNFERTVFFYQGNTNLVRHESSVDFWGLFWNTILYAGGGALIYALMPGLVAYLCAKYDYKLSRIIFFVFTLMMCMPIVGNYPTELTFLRNVGLYDTIWGNYIQKMSGSGMYFFVYYAFFQGLSNTYREAAEIDGASELHIMTSIYFPMAIKMFFTVFLLQFVWLWNDYQTPLLYLPTRPTLAYAIFYLTTDFSKFRELQPVPARVAACMLLALPILVIYILFRDKLTGNISLGGIKE